MLDLKPIRVFLAVADRQSFSGAAAELGLAAASVTRIIAQLEADLGTQLLVRTTRQVGLTSAGALVLARYRPLVEGFDAVTQDVLRAARPDRGRLRITAPVSLGLQMLPEVIAGFRQAYPGIAVDLSLNDALVDVISETCDLAIRVSGAPSDKSTIWRKLTEVPRRAVAAPSLAQRMDLPAHPSELDPAFMLSYSATGERESWSFSQPGASVTVRAGDGVISNNGDFLCALARAGEGICVLPEFLVQEGLESGALIKVLPGWSLPSLWLTLFYPPYEKLPPLVDVFAEYFESYVLSGAKA